MASFENPNISRRDFFKLFDAYPKRLCRVSRFTEGLYNLNLTIADMPLLLSKISSKTRQKNATIPLEFAASPSFYERDVFGTENSLCEMFPEWRNDREIYESWLLNPNINLEKLNYKDIKYMIDIVAEWLGPYNPVKLRELYLSDEENKAAYRVLTRLPNYKTQGNEYLPLEIRGKIGEFLGVSHDDKNYNEVPFRENPRKSF